MDLNTHLGINRSLCGEVLSVDEGAAVIKIATTREMVADDHGRMGSNLYY